MTTNHVTQAMANPEIIADLVKRFKEYRLTYRPTQQEAAEKAGVSLITLRQFENGKAYNIDMGNFLFLLRVVDCLGTDGRPAAGTCFSIYYGTNNE